MNKNYLMAVFVFTVAILLQSVSSTSYSYSTDEVVSETVGASQPGSEFAAQISSLIVSTTKPAVPVDKCGGQCTDLCAPCTRTCPMGEGDGGANCAEKDASYSCVPKTCPGPYDYPSKTMCCGGQCIDPENRACCGNKIAYNPVNKLCCGDKNVYSIDSEKHCCSDGAYISNCGCCDYTIVCGDFGFGNMGLVPAYAPNSPCTLLVDNSLTGGLQSLSCNAPGNVLPRGSILGLMNLQTVTNMAQCSLMHELRHMNDMENGNACADSRLCESESSAYGDTANCLYSYYLSKNCNTNPNGPECAEIIAGWNSANSLHSFMNCLCSSTSTLGPSVTSEICSSCMLQAFGPGVCVQEAADYCRHDGTVEGNVVYQCGGV